MSGTATPCSAEPPASCKVYTSPDLAAAIVGLLRTGDSARWLEPGSGHGAFIKAISSIGVRPEKIVAVDLDRAPHANDSLARTTRGVDFLQWAQMTTQRFDRVVGNPPYVSISQLSREVRRAALRLSGPAKLKVCPGANAWYAFICASLKLLKPAGGLGMILPASFEYASYARPLRDSLKALFREVRVLRSRKPLFDNVQEGSVVLICFGFRLGPGTLARQEYDHLHALVSGLEDLQISRARNAGKEFLTNTEHQERWRLGDELEISIGAVTGDSHYFLLTEYERLELKLPVQACRSVVSRARHLTAATMTSSEWQELRESGQRIWLFNPPQRMLQHPAVRAYLRLRRDNGGCTKERYKIRIRKPWHKTPMPESADGFLSGMSKCGPWIAFRAKKGLNATNTLYIVRFRSRLSREQKYAYALSLLTTPARQALHAVCRHYAAGLEKFEPGDLLAIHAPVPQRYRGAKCLYEQAVLHLLAGRPRQSRQIADAYVLGDPQQSRRSE